MSALQIPSEVVSNRLELPAEISHTVGQEIEAIYKSNVVETQAILISLQQQGNLSQINSQYYRNYSPLVGSASRGELEKVKLLVEQASAKDFLIRPDGIPCPGPSALHAAACSAQVETVNYLLSQGAKPDGTFTESGYKYFQFPHLIEWYCQKVIDPSEKKEEVDLYQRQCACLRSLLIFTKDLVALREQLSITKKSCLEIVLRSDRRDIVELLQEFGFAGSELEHPSTRESFFIYAIDRGHLSMVQWFVDTYHMDVNGFSKLSYLHIAKAKRHEELVQYLLQQGADPSALNDQGEDYLTYAQKQISLRAFRGLAHHFRSMGGFEEFQNFEECCSFLRKEDINLVADQKGNTLLHLAAQWPAHVNFYEIFISSLLRMGADPSLKNNKGKTPFEVGKDVIEKIYARRENIEEMCHRLHAILPQQSP